MINTDQETPMDNDEGNGLRGFTAQRKHETDWPSWFDQRRYRIGLIVFLAFFLLYGLLVYVSGARPLTALKQASMALIGVVISAVFGVIVGVPLAKRRVKIATQLRRAYGISQTLRNVQRDVDDAIDRMARRDGLTDADTVGEFWKEIAGNIRTSIREPISEAERMIEDWGDMDPEERSRIQTEEDRKAQVIEELTKRIETAKSVERDLEVVGRGSPRLAAAVQMEERRVRELEEENPTRRPSFVTGSAQVKINLGQYDEAVAIYDALIRDYPIVHTNYIGRAKAKYLAGDTAGALVDLKTARKLFPSDPVIDRLEAEITTGKAVTTPLDPTVFNEMIEGNQALARADSESAAKHYQRAGELGGNPFYVKFNMAMVKCLEGNYVGAKQTLDDLRAEAESYMAINKYALLTICAILENGSATAELEELRRLVKERSVFDYLKSPLRHLEAGFRVLGEQPAQSLAPVFSALRESPE